jgi:hypothetical protein
MFSFLKKTPTNTTLKQELDLEREIAADLRRDYSALTFKYGDLEAKYDKLEQAFKTFGDTYDAQEKRKAELITLLEEADNIFTAIPASKLSQERAARIAKWQARAEQLAMLDGKAKEA